MVTSDDGSSNAILASTPTKSAWTKNPLVYWMLVGLVVLGVAGAAVAIVFGVVLPKGDSSSSVNGGTDGASIAPPSPAPTDAPTIASTNTPTALRATGVPTSLVAPTFVPIATNLTMEPTNTTSEPTNATLEPTFFGQTPSPTVSSSPSLRPSIAPSLSNASASLAPSPLTNTTSSFPPTQATNISSTLPPTEATNSSELSSFSFYAMGDIPYSRIEVAILDQQIADMNINRRNDSIFMMHVGDIMYTPRSLCDESYYVSVRNQLLNGVLPTFVIPGDNDGDDCPDPAQGWALFNSYYTSFEQNWNSRLPAGVPLLNVARDTERPNMFVFVHSDVVFLSVNFIDDYPNETDTVGIAEAESRILNSTNWVISNVQQQSAQRTIRAIIIFAHSVTDTNNRPFFEAIYSNFTALGVASIPVMYLHGHDHTFSIETTLGEYLGWSSFIEVQVDNGAASDPLLVEIAPVVNGQMVPLAQESDMQYVWGEGLIRLDRQKGLYATTTRKAAH